MKTQCTISGCAKAAKPGTGFCKRHDPTTVFCRGCSRPAKKGERYCRRHLKWRKREHPRLVQIVPAADYDALTKILAMGWDGASSEEILAALGMTQSEVDCIAQRHDLEVVPTLTVRTLPSHHHQGTCRINLADLIQCDFFFSDARVGR